MSQNHDHVANLHSALAVAAEAAAAADVVPDPDLDQDPAEDLQGRPLF
jgi:hypothetical protein